MTSKRTVSLPNREEVPPFGRRPTRLRNHDRAMIRNY